MCTTNKQTDILKQALGWLVDDLMDTLSNGDPVSELFITDLCFLEQAINNATDKYLGYPALDYPIPALPAKL